MPKYRSVLPLIAVVSAVSALAQGASSSSFPFEGEPLTASVSQLQAASAAMPVDKAFAVQILYEERDYKIAADGTLIYRHHLIYRVNSQDGVEGWSEISANWDPWFEKPSTLRARTLQVDGKIVELDQKTVTDAPVKADDSETYSSAHVRRAPLPGVAVGAIIEEMVETAEKTAYFKDGSLYGFQVRENVPVGRIRFVIDLPVGMAFKDQVVNASMLKVDRSEVNGQRHIVYEALNVAPRHNSDIDLNTNEPSLARVDFATGASWEAVAAGYASLSDPQTSVAEGKLILPAVLPEERMARIRAIVQKLHHDVRYTGVEFGSARLTPVRPSQVLERHYGDCKDKATVLVAMLRAAGIPANLALLETGPGEDVPLDMPGMNRFDHAIVYVPATKNDAALWIDATAQYYEVGTLPFDDQGRRALVIAPETKALIVIPAPVAADSRLEETRTFKLAGFGPSRVEESSKTYGYVDANYRVNYGAAEDKKLREEMESYIQRAYLSKKLVTVTHGDGMDLSHPFTLGLVAEGARRGVTAMTDAVVVVFPTNGTSSLPKWFNEAPTVVGPDTSAEAKAEMALEVSNRKASYIFQPFIKVQKTQVMIPAGFVARALPANKTTAIGAASMTETYSQTPGMVTAEYSFNSGPGQLTTEQALAMRTAVLEFNKREYVGLFFDQVGAKALAAGHIREALDADRAAIKAQPNDGLAHSRLARALLDAGIGSAAQVEARKGTELEPKSAPAYLTLGWTLEHDSLGNRFGKGFDLAGALAAYQTAMDLSPEDHDAAYSRAILLEFDGRGSRYAPEARLGDAIAGYQALIKQTKDTEPAQADRYRDNMLYVLLFARRFADLDKELAVLPATNAHTTLAISSATAQKGAAAGIARADKGNVSITDRNSCLRTAGGQLARLHLYSEAAEVMSAGIQGAADTPMVARQIELYRGLKGVSLQPLSQKDPASPVQILTLGVMAGTLTQAQAADALSRQAYTSSETLNDDVKKNLQSEGFMKAVAEKSDMAESVLLDLLGGSMKFKSTGDDTVGYSVLAEIIGSEPSRYYVVREEGKYRVIADEHDNAQVGNAVLYALSHDKPGEAKALLDWKRDFTHKGGTDDAFEGPLLPRFWTVGSAKAGADSPAAMRLAGISLLAGHMDAKPYLQELAGLREKASGQRQMDLDLLLAVEAVGAEDGKMAQAASARLLEQEPDSLTALRLAGQAYAFENDVPGWQKLLQPKLAKAPKDHDVLSEQARAYELAKDFNNAQMTEQKVLETSKASSSDYNSYAWLGLFRGEQGLGDAATKAAQQSNMMSKNSSFADLHTLACVYAAEGKTTEARQVLAQAMFAGNQSEPNSAVWYALGLIYEQYGERDAALAAYRKVQAHEGDRHQYVDPVSTYVLAQGRIAKLAGL